MIEGKKVLAIIPARGGSKGVPGKNILKLGGKALIGWTIEAAKEADYIDHVYVSTDCEEIRRVSESYGAEIERLRPAKLATDTAKTVDVIEDVLSNVDAVFDYIMLLQPTSPFRQTKHINEALELMFFNKKESLFSVSELGVAPEWLYVLDGEGKPEPLLPGEIENTRRQDASKLFSLNGAIYICSVNFFRENRGMKSDSSIAYVMGAKESIDIDTHYDFRLAKLLVEEASS